MIHQANIIPRAECHRDGEARCAEIARFETLVRVLAHRQRAADQSRFRTARTFEHWHYRRRLQARVCGAARPGRHSDRCAPYQSADAPTGDVSSHRLQLGSKPENGGLESRTPPLCLESKKAHGYGLSGGEGGIRTHGTLITFCGFQDRCIQPLCHLSKTRKPHTCWVFRTSPQAKILVLRRFGKIW